MRFQPPLVQSVGGFDVDVREGADVRLRGCAGVGCWLREVGVVWMVGSCQVSGEVVFACIN